MSELIDYIETSVNYIQGKDGKPYFRYGDIVEVDNEVNILNRVLSGQNKKFPFVYMNTNYEETVTNEQRTAGITLYIVNRSNSEYTAYQRHEKELPVLRVLSDALLRAMQTEGKIDFNEHKKKEIFYKAEENEFSTPVNVIRLIFNEIFYCLT